MAETKNKSKVEDSSEATTEGSDDPSARGRILDAAIKLFVDQGLAGTSTRDIAKASGLNVSLISYYFGGKEGLYKAVLENFADSAGKEMEKLFAEFGAETMTPDRFKKQMKKMIYMTVQLKLNHPSIFILLQREVSSGMPFARDIIEHKFDFMIEAMAGLYAEGQAKGFVRKDVNPYIVFLSLVHAIDVYMQTCRCGGSIMEKIYTLPEQQQEYSEQVFKIFVEGVMI